MSLRTLIGLAAMGSIAMGIHAQTIHGVAPHAGGSYSSISDISSDGSVASGWSDNASSVDLALRWQLSSGSTNLGLLPGGAFNSYAEAISSNGAMLAGYGGTPSGTRAFRWNGSYQVLPPLPGHTFATGNDISGDGSRVTGKSGVGATQRAFLWNASTPASSVDLGVVAGQGWSEGRAISPDGLTVTGASGSVAFRWTSGGGMQSLGSLSGQSSAVGLGTSTDGSVIAGIWRPGFNDRGFRWTASAGMVDLGLFSGGSVFRVRDMSADGVAVVGQGDGSSGLVSCIWTPRNGLQTLAQHLQARGVNLSGWTLTDCTAVNANASAFGGIGYLNGSPRGWVVRGLNAPAFTAIPGTWTFCVNTTQILHFSGAPGMVTGTGLQFRWFRNGVLLTEGLQASNATITGTSTQFLTFSNLTAAEAGVYTMEATVQGAAPVMGPPQTVIINSIAPTITQQPVPASGCVGSAVSLTVGAVPNAGSLAFQWQRRVNPFPNVYEDISDGPTGFGSTFSGTTSATLTINNAQTGDSNRYRCLVMNTQCFRENYVSSDRVLVTISGTTSVVSGPVNTTVCHSPSAIAQFTVSATPANVTYQWQKRVDPFPNVYADIFDGPTGNGGSYFGTQTATLSIAGPNSGDFTRYRCNVTGPCDNAITPNALLSPAYPFTITEHPDDADVCPGGSGILSITLGRGTIGTPTFQWHIWPGIPISNGPQPSGSFVTGAQTASMTITGFTPADTALYFCQVSAPCGLASSAYALLEYCSADFNCDGGIDGDDISAFFDQWGNGEMIADVNGDGGVDGDDILTFFTAWENGGC